MKTNRGSQESLTANFELWILNPIFYLPVQLTTIEYQVNVKLAANTDLWYLLPNLSLQTILCNFGR